MVRRVLIRSPVFTILPAEQPNSRRTPSIPNFDLRAEKLVAFPHLPGKIGIYDDVFNVTNVGRALGVTALSGPSFGVPSLWTEPRTAQLSGTRSEYLLRVRSLSLPPSAIRPVASWTSLQRWR